MTSRTINKCRAVFEGLLDYYDEKEHFYQDEVEMVENMKEDDALYTLQKIPDELVRECFHYVSKTVLKQFSGPKYVCDAMLGGDIGKLYIDSMFLERVAPGKMVNLFQTPLADLLRDLPLPILLKFVEEGTPSKYLLTIYPVKHQTIITDIHGEIMKYCDNVPTLPTEPTEPNESNEIQKEELVGLVLEMLLWAKDYSTKKGFEAYIRKFGFWRCYHMNSSFLTKNQNKMAAWIAYCRASRPIFRGIFRKLVLSIMYVHSKTCKGHLIV